MKLTETKEEMINNLDNQIIEIEIKIIKLQEELDIILELKREIKEND